MPRTSPLKSLGNLLDSLRQPVYVIHKQRRIIYCNAACAAWLGVSADQLLGRQCNYAATPTGAHDALPCALAPPPHVLAGEECSAPLSVLRPDGNRSRRLARFMPLAVADTDKTSQSSSTAILVLVAADELEQADSPAAADVDGQDAAALHAEIRELLVSLRSRFRLDRLVGGGARMAEVRARIAAAIQSGANVVVIGPPGSGREHVARMIHHGDPTRPAGPLLPLSCGDLEPQLLQTTVMAFLRRCRETSASQAPTVLLLDIDQMSRDAQAELGGELRTAGMPIRLLVTARHSLLTPPLDRSFPVDLARMLSTIEIELPALADRREDLPVLAQQLVEEYNARGGKQFSGLTPDALDRLTTLPWPGNVAELANVITTMCDTSSGPWLDETQFPRSIRQYDSAAAHPRPRDERIAWDEFFADLQRQVLTQALELAKGNKAQAARLLGLSRLRVLRLVKQLLGQETDPPG